MIGQQISLAAAAAIRARLAALFDDRLPTAAELLVTDDPTLRDVGLSRAQAIYLTTSPHASLTAAWTSTACARW